MYHKKRTIPSIVLMTLTLLSTYAIQVAASDIPFNYPDQPGSTQHNVAVANAPATSFTVNSTLDGGDANPGNGVCETSPGNGVCTLRAAIQETNELSGSDIIDFLATVSMVAPMSPLPTLNDPSGGTTIQGDGDDTAIIGNAAPANADGLVLASDGNKVQGLIIVNFDGSGVKAYGNNNVIGTDGDGVDDDTERNIISNNGEKGVEIRDGATGNRVAGNWIGLAVDGVSPVGNEEDGVSIFGGSSMNLIGTNGDGTSDDLERNVIAASGEHGIEISGSGTDNNVVAGNYIGVDITGNSVISNTWSGIMVTGGSANNRIGTNGDGLADAQEGNVISGNGAAGVRLDNGSSGNVVAGNYIGTNAVGDAALPNDSYGVLIQQGSANNLVGTNGDGQSDELERNIISGNNSTGVQINNEGTDDNVVAGNYIGTNAAGNAAIPNGGRGVTVQSCADTRVGGTTPAERNVISSNGYDGVQVYSATMTLVQGNFIGTDASGQVDLGNTYHGVNVTSGATGTQVGGTTGSAANRIAFNGSAGIRVSEYTPTNQLSYDNRLRGNRIWANGDLGIDLWLEEGVTPNDLGDGDDGPNHLQNYPVLSAAARTDGRILIAGTLNSSADTVFSLDFYGNTSCDPSGYGEGEIYLGTYKLTTDSSGNANFSTLLTRVVPVGYAATATATDPTGNTSEFSACFTIVEGFTVYLPLVISNN